jgi:hypothetical protein
MSHANATEYIFIQNFQSLVVLTPTLRVDGGTETLAQRVFRGIELLEVPQRCTLFGGITLFTLLRNRC